MKRETETGREDRKPKPSLFESWQPIIFGAAVFILSVVVRLFLPLLYPLKPYANSPLGYCPIDRYWECSSYYTNYANTLQGLSLIIALGVYMLDGLFLSWSAKKFGTQSHWAAFILLLPVAFLLHVSDLRKLRMQDSTSTVNMQ